MLGLAAAGLQETERYALRLMHTTWYMSCVLWMLFDSVLLDVVNVEEEDNKDRVRAGELGDLGQFSFYAG